jgi:uncharacterized protein YjbI with pentapeptide repeats
MKSKKPPQASPAAHIKNSHEYEEQLFFGVAASERTFEDVRFVTCTFRHSHFDHASFLRCRFNDCAFIDCRLDLMNVTGSRFTDARFTDCRMQGVDWTRAHWSSIRLPAMLHFQRCLLNDSSFFGLHLEGMKAIECRAIGVDFTEADCVEADFSGSDFQDALFRKTRLAGANFTDAINYRIDIFNNDIRRARFCMPEAAALLHGLDIDLVE